jgi:hypothetical protein
MATAKLPTEYLYYTLLLFFHRLRHLVIIVSETIRLIVKVAILFRIGSKRCPVVVVVFAGMDSPGLYMAIWRHRVR